MKIAICGLVKNDNLGERFISDSLSWIVADVLREHNITESLEFIETDISARNDIISDYKSHSENKKLNLYNYDCKAAYTDKLYKLLIISAKIFKPIKIKNVFYKARHFL